MLKDFSDPDRDTMNVVPVYARLHVKTPIVVLAFLFLVVGAWCADAVADAPAPATDTLLRTEYLLFGKEASLAWRGLSARSGLAFDQIGGDGLGDEFGGGSSDSEEEEEEEEDKGPSNTGDKVKAGLLSAVLPGAGQFYNDQKPKAYVMVGIEAGIWIAYFVFDSQGDSEMDSAREWAGIYAGTSGEHTDSYWQNVGQFMDSDAYNESRLREARALGEEPSGLVGPEDAWQWVNEERLDGYGQLRADGNSAYDRRDFMILFAVVNRAVSVVDAVLNAGKPDGVLETEVMGLDLQLEMLPSFTDPGARWTLSRSF
jgi:hypothetical protein